ncbi:MAG TPA: hypothetical protein VE130_10480 [Nitrososphaeraceae archaeon]|nr:hypothetical protein [Nitrososphaeraceae archaeon]
MSECEAVYLMLDVVDAILPVILLCIAAAACTTKYRNISNSNKGRRP